MFPQTWQDHALDEHHPNPKMKCNTCHELKKSIRLRRETENGDDADLSECYYHDEEEYDNDNDELKADSNGSFYDNDYEYDYDNYQHEFKYNSGQRASVVANCLKLVPPASSSSAYDTCSNLSNELSKSSKSSSKTSSSKSSASSNYGVLSQSQSQSVSPTISERNVVEEKRRRKTTPLVDTTASVEEKNNCDTNSSMVDTSMNTSSRVGAVVAGQIPIDETSTINTDVSDPHWDGYTVIAKY